MCAQGAAALSAARLDSEAGSRSGSEGRLPGVCLGRRRGVGWTCNTGVCCLRSKVSAVILNLILKTAPDTILPSLEGSSNQLILSCGQVVPWVVIQAGGIQTLEM